MALPQTVMTPDIIHPTLTKGNCKIVSANENNISCTVGCWLGVYYGR